MYKISKSYSDAQDNTKNRRIQTTLISPSDINKNKREPPRASSELHPPVPKKFPRTNHPKGGGTFFNRNVNVPDQQPLKKVLPLQIQSPSMMKTFQRASSTENLHNGSTSARFSNASKTHFKSEKDNKTYFKN